MDASHRATRALLAALRPSIAQRVARSRSSPFGAAGGCRGESRPHRVDGERRWRGEDFGGAPPEILHPIAQRADAVPHRTTRSIASSVVAGAYRAAPREGAAERRWIFAAQRTAPNAARRWTGRRVRGAIKSPTAPAPCRSARADRAPRRALAEQPVWCRLRPSRCVEASPGRAMETLKRRGFVRGGRRLNSLCGATHPLQVARIHGCGCCAVWCESGRAAVGAATLVLIVVVRGVRVTPLRRCKGEG